MIHYKIIIIIQSMFGFIVNSALYSTNHPMCLCCGMLSINTSLTIIILPHRMQTLLRARGTTGVDNMLVQTHRWYYRWYYRWYVYVHS